MVFCVTCDPCKKYLIILEHRGNDISKRNRKQPYSIIHASKKSYDSCYNNRLYYTWDIEHGINFHGKSLSDLSPDVKILPRRYIDSGGPILIKVPDATLLWYSTAANYDYLSCGYLKYISLAINSMRVNYYAYHSIVPNKDIRYCLDMHASSNVRGLQVNEVACKYGWSYYTSLQVNINDAAELNEIPEILKDFQGTYIYKPMRRRFTDAYTDVIVICTT